MEYPFMMYGRVIQIYRFRVGYRELFPESEEEQEVVEYCRTEKQARALALKKGGTVTELDAGAYEWLEGIKVADVPDTYGEAVRIYEMGREAYEAERQAPTPEETIASLKEQVMDLQLALCDFYESVVV